MSEGVASKTERDRALELLATLDDIPLHTVRESNTESLKIRNTMTVDPQGACQGAYDRTYRVRDKAAADTRLSPRPKVICSDF